MNHVKRALLGSILLWAILLSACGPSTNSANTLSAIYTAAAQTIVAQQPTVEQSATPMPTDTASMLTPTDSGITTPTVLPTLVSSLPTSATSVTSDSSCNSSYVADATIPDGTVMSPGQTFVKTWTLQNTGSCTWDTSFTMRFFSGDQMSGGNGIVSSSVAPGGQGNVSVTLTAPITAGTYTGNWRLADDSGITFGEIVDVVIDVNGSETDTPIATATDTPGTYTPAPTATNTPVPPATSTPVPSATNTPVPSATNTPVTPVVATNTPVTPAPTKAVPTSSTP